MDGRIALAPGAVLKLETSSGCTLYTINKEVGRGASCIVYDASYTDNLGNFKLVRIKECYPHAMHLSRESDGILSSEARDADAFAAAKERMIVAYQKNHTLFYTNELTNSITNTSNIYWAGGTVYIVSVYMNGKTFSEHQGDTLHDCVSLLLSTAKVLKSIHDAGYLYLDLKPDNILTLEGSLDLVQLFDFDSLVSMEELARAIRTGNTSDLHASYTRGFASLEQQTGKLRQMGKHSDLYSLGAVLFYALWHKTPSAFDSDPSAEYDYHHMLYAAKTYQDRLFLALTTFFHKTLASYTLDRYQNAEEAIAKMKEILVLSDETRPWLLSTPIQKLPVFYGRKEEIKALSDMLQQTECSVSSLYGMGGIGKSTLVRQYLIEHASDWDASVWLYDRGNLSECIEDDRLVQINTIHRLKEESGKEYLERKLQALSDLAHQQRFLLVLDNFHVESLDQLELFRKVGWTILLVSRERMPDGMFPAMHLEEMTDEALERMFVYYSHYDLEEEADRTCFQTILEIIDRHTLLMELIARQVAKSFLNLQEAEKIVARMSLSDLPSEKIDYIRDQSAYHGTMLAILDRFVEIDRFTEQDRNCMKLLSLFNMPGLEADLLKTLAELETLDFINDLKTSGWVKSEKHMFYLHPMMQEYIRTWPWTDTAKAAADRMMENLYKRIRPAGTRHDGSRQFPENYGSFYRLIRVIPQIIDNLGYVSEISQRLLYRWLMDAPVDQDTSVLFRMLDLLKDTRYLDDDSILRLYETAAYYRARLYAPDEAIELLQEMRQYLLKHPSAYYLSAYHRAMAVILHNEFRDLKDILQHENCAIAAARLSRHPEAKKQLTACLMNKARTLMSAEKDQAQVRSLIREAEPIVNAFTSPTDYERYQFACNAAMCSAMDGDLGEAQHALDAADAIAYAAPDSDLAIAEHLIEEVAPIRIAMKQFNLAEKAVLEAIALCEKHLEVLRYRETIFNAYLFLGRVFAMDKDYIKAEEAFVAAEKRVHDSPYVWKLPLCPEKVREEAERIRSDKNT